MTSFESSERFRETQRKGESLPLIKQMEPAWTRKIVNQSSCNSAVPTLEHGGEEGWVGTHFYLSSRFFPRIEVH